MNHPAKSRRTTNGAKPLEFDAARKSLAHVIRDINGSQQRSHTFWDNVMGLLLVDRHNAPFFGKLLKSCRAIKGRDSRPTDEARRSLGRWARAAEHARPLKQRCGQTGAVPTGVRVLEQVKSVPEAKARIIGEFLATEDSDHDLGLVVRLLKGIFTRQGLSSGASRRAEGEELTMPTTPATCDGAASDREPLDAVCPGVSRASIDHAPDDVEKCRQEQLAEKFANLESEFAEMRRSFSETERSLAAEIRGLRSALLEEQRGRMMDNARWERRLLDMSDRQEVMEIKLGDALRLADETFVKEGRPGKVGEGAAAGTVEEDTDTERDPGSMEDETENVEEVWTQREDEETSRQILPHYHKEGLLGCGSFGFVLACRKKHDSGATEAAAVAIKVLSKEDMEMAANKLAGLKAEKEALEAFDSPFVLHLVETAQDVNNVFFVTELLIGGNLHERIKSFASNRLPASNVLFYAANVVEALAYIHSRGYAYRDLKPENLMIDAQGYIRVVDMGMARKIPYDDKDEEGVMRIYTRAFSHVGTPLYMAPEVYARTGHDQSVDIWALGVMVFEMLEGRNPFELGKEENRFTFNLDVIVQRKVLATNKAPIEFSGDFDLLAGGASCRDFITRAMTYSAEERVRNVGGGMVGLKNHQWLEGVDWEALRAKQLPAPWKPDGGPCYDEMEGWDGEDLDEEYTGDQAIFEGF